MAYVYWIKAPHHTDMVTQGYIGYTSRTVEVRFNEHIKHAQSELTVKHILHKAINKYLGNLEVVTLVEGSEEYCLFIEEGLRPYSFTGWNQNKGGSKPPSPLGRKVNPDSAKKVWESRRKNLVNETSEQREKRLASYSKWSDESKKKFSESRTGIKFSSEHLANMRLAQLGKKQSQVSVDKRRDTKASRTYAEINPWESGRANKDIWALSKEVYKEISHSPSSNVRDIEVRLSVAKQKLTTIFKKIKSGWNPSEDLSYLAWLDEYNKIKECPNGT